MAFVPTDNHRAIGTDGVQGSPSPIQTPPEGGIETESPLVREMATEAAIFQSDEAVTRIPPP